MNLALRKRARACSTAWARAEGRSRANRRRPAVLVDTARWVEWGRGPGQAEWSRPDRPSGILPGPRSSRPGSAVSGSFGEAVQAEAFRAAGTSACNRMGGTGTSVMTRCRMRTSIIALEGRQAGQQLVENGTQGVDIRGRTGLLALGLFGGHALGVPITIPNGSRPALLPPDAPGQSPSAWASPRRSSGPAHLPPSPAGHWPASGRGE